MPESTRESCYRVIAEEFEVDAPFLSDGTNMLVAWGMDDLDVLQLTHALENEFRLTLDEADVEAAVTVGDVVRLIDSELSETNPKNLNGH